MQDGEVIEQSAVKEDFPMHDYEPLDLSALTNSGPEAFVPDHRPALGKQMFHGLPFQIGDEEGKPCFLAFGTEAQPGNAPVSIPLGRTTRNVIFAHVLLQSRLHEGDPPGRIVAHYAFVFADGQRVDVPIRERFEIGAVPVGWGELPFLAVPDRSDSLMDRYQGEWGSTGFRQSESRQAWPNSYHLWFWQNPRPDTVIERIEIEPQTEEGCLPFLLAAITLGHSDEEPFRRSAAIPIKLTLPQAEDAAAPFALEVTVDRGVATYPYALPEQPADAFLTDSRAGWGEAQNPNNSPAYVEIAAIPSATVTAKKKDEILGSAS